jgi:hypothetical protein
MKIRLGLYYVQTYSLAADLKLVAATIVAVAGVDPAWCMPSWVPIQAAQSATS